MLDLASGTGLDLASGTGSWCTEMSKQYPSALIVGADNCAAKYIGTSPNVSFVSVDIENTLPFPDCQFDLVNSLANTPKIMDWHSYIAELYRLTASDGWVQLIESNAQEMQCDDGTLPLISAMRRWFQIQNAASLSMGVDTSVHLKLARYLKDAGFINVQEYIYKIPGNAWPKSIHGKEMGRLLLGDMTEGIGSYGKEALSILGKLKCDSEINEFLEKLKAELGDVSIHWYWEWRCVVGQKAGF